MLVLVLVFPALCCGVNVPEEEAWVEEDFKEADVELSGFEETAEEGFVLAAVVRGLAAAGVMFTVVVDGLAAERLGGIVGGWGDVGCEVRYCFDASLRERLSVFL